MLPQPRRRWAFFPRSVISDHDNPSAHLYRAMARKIDSIGDEARFYEERANPWLRNMLHEDGAESFRSFQERYPEVSYITYEPRYGHQLADWINLTLATVDIAVVDSEAPAIIVKWVGELTRPRLHTFLLDPDGNITRARQLPEQASLYQGFCSSVPDLDAPALESIQRLIAFGPALPAPGRNGSATRHIASTAEHLIAQLVDAVDESLVERTDDASSNSGTDGSGV